MNAQQYLLNKKTLQNHLLQFIDSENDVEENYSQLLQVIKEQKIKENNYDIDLFLHSIIEISNNHNRSINFYQKIEQILKLFIDKIKSNKNNFEIFSFFKTNKRLLLFLIEENVILVNEHIVEIIKMMKYDAYFYPEIKSFISDSLNNDLQKNISDDFDENRRKGENHNYICKLIRNDSIEEFIIYAEKEFLELNNAIPKSIFETNSNMLNGSITLIQYAAFYGSIQIFKYLLLNGAKLDLSLWKFAVHGSNEEIFHLLEENNIIIKDTEIKNLIIESIKCYEKEVMDYFNKFNNEIDFSDILQYYNFEKIELNEIKPKEIFYLCSYNYYDMVKLLLEEKYIDINQEII